MFTKEEKAMLLRAIEAAGASLMRAASKMKINLAADAYKKEAADLRALYQKVEGMK